MPGWMQTVVSLNPVKHLTNAARRLMRGEPHGDKVVWVLAASVLITATAAPVAMRLYHRERYLRP